jgi:predicted transcriptional regulator YheO
MDSCIVGIRDGLGHLVGLLCIKFREDILIINVARPILLEFADSPIYLPSSI